MSLLFNLKSLIIPVKYRNYETFMPFMTEILQAQEEKTIRQLVPEFTKKTTLYKFV